MYSFLIITSSLIQKYSFTLAYLSGVFVFTKFIKLSLWYLMDLLNIHTFCGKMLSVLIPEYRYPKKPAGSHV